MKKTTLVSLMLCFLLALSAVTLLAQNNTNTNTGANNEQNQAQQTQGNQQMPQAQTNVDGQGNANNPVTNQNANACFWGGSLGGMCDTQWEWECGWGVIRVEYGMIPAALLSQQCQTFRTTPNAAQFMMTATPIATSTGDDGTGNNAGGNNNTGSNNNNGGASATSVPTTNP